LSSHESRWDWRWCWGYTEERQSVGHDSIIARFLLRPSIKMWSLQKIVTTSPPRPSCSLFVLFYYFCSSIKAAKWPFHMHDVSSLHCLLLVVVYPNKKRKNLFEGPSRVDKKKSPAIHYIIINL
jgi:hypothetical protein